MIDAATGTASNPPTNPNSEEPMSAATIVTAPGTFRARFMILGVTT